VEYLAARVKDGKIFIVIPFYTEKRDKEVGSQEMNIKTTATMTIHSISASLPVFFKYVNIFSEAQKY
jgi:hypothetical protein